MGCTRCSLAQVTRMISEMRREWKGCTYDLFSRNCHHFSNELCMRLGVGPLPAWVNDLATSFAAEPEDGSEAAGGAATTQPSEASQVGAACCPRSWSGSGASPLGVHSSEGSDVCPQVAQFPPPAAHGQKAVKTLALQRRPWQ